MGVIFERKTANERCAKTPPGGGGNENDSKTEQIANLKQMVSQLSSLIESQNIQIDSLQQENNSLKKDKESIMTKLEQELMCAVCLMVPRDDVIPVCKNGHICCKSCKIRMAGMMASFINRPALCPTCQVEMGSMFSPIAQNLSELVEFACIYEEEGCTVKLAKQQISKHQEICPKKPAKPSMWESLCLIIMEQSSRK